MQLLSTMYTVGAPGYMSVMYCIISTAKAHQWVQTIRLLTHLETRSDVGEVYTLRTLRILSQAKFV